MRNGVFRTLAILLGALNIMILAWPLKDFDVGPIGWLTHVLLAALLLRFGLLGKRGFTTSVLAGLIKPLSKNAK